jgi:hypothetical protein
MWDNERWKEYVKKKYNDNTTWKNGIQNVKTLYIYIYKEHIVKNQQWNIHMFYFYI